MGHPNPMIDVESPKRNKSRDRVLTNDEIQLIWKACEDWEAEAIRDKQFKASTGSKGGSGGQPSLISRVELCCSF